MPLLAGTRLGPYEILAPIGAGGMGEVYRAKDTKLKREVALKVLPDSFASDPERMARFQREAEVLAALSHPNIAAIYGIEDRALVMELVAGENLKGPLPIETSLNYAKQIADALEAAHEKGITHRDLKPANIMITTAGVVKVLDFGLATISPDPSSGSADRPNSPTLTMRATQAGMLMGTAAYMSPEQAAGKPVDKRADIWSFGVVLWELLTGKRLFDGETISHTLADVLRAPIDFRPLPAKTPKTIRDLLGRCLNRDAKKRLRDIGEARIAIEESLSGTEKEPEADSTVISQQRAIVPWVAAVALVAAGVAGWGWWRATRPVERPLVRLDVDLGPEISLPDPAPGGTRNTVSISPNGTRLAYVASGPGVPAKLFTRRLDQPKATELAGTEGAAQPFFSPDGQWIGFSAGAKLSKISVEGGAVVPLGDASSFPGASWGEDGIVVGGLITGLMRIPSGGGAPTPVTEMRKGEIAHGLPQVLPGGKAVLFVAYTANFDVDKATIEVVSLRDHRRKTVVQGGTSPYYLPSGHLVYFNKGTLFAIPFDLDRLETRGTAVPVLDGIAYQAQLGIAHMDFSRAPAGPGTLVYRKGDGGGLRMSTVQWLDGAGKKEPLLAKPGSYGDLRLSPDGKRLALVVREEGRADIWVYDPQRDAMTRLTVAGPYGDPIWSPDGRYLVFASFASVMFWTRADGAGQPQAFALRSAPFPTSFSPDGKRLAFYQLNSASSAVGAEIWTVPIEDNGGQLQAGRPEPFLRTQFYQVDASFSPDGRWLAYQSNESGMNEIYVRAFPPPASGQGGQWQISNSGGTRAHWSRNGHELVYQSAGQLMAASYTTRGDTFVAEKPRVWIAKLGGALWDLAPDGKRVAVLTPVESAEAPKADHEVGLLLNFFDELHRRAPTGK
jgi:serine/threonine protein kinase/Tol biopolymer transport system component